MTLGGLLFDVALAELGLALVMSVAWAIQRASGNSGWIDAAWTFGVGALGVVLALEGAGGLLARRCLVAALAALWALRLGLHIVRRTKSAGDDPRYRKLLDEWGAAAPLRLFQFLQAQAAVGAALALAIGLAAKTPALNLRIQDVVGVVLLAVSLAGEALADAQLARFKAGSANRGRVCDTGLWSRSRHPNYFFEWLAWVAYPIVAIDVSGGYPYGYLALLAPALMYWTLRYVSGVPPLEEHMERTRPEAFARYREGTPIFFPRWSADSCSRPR